MSKIKEKYVFNSNWLIISWYSSWFQKCFSKYRSYCSLCCKYFYILNIRVSPLVSHTAGKKRLQIAASRAICLDFLFQMKNLVSATRNCTNLKTCILSSMLTSTSTSWAEILWLLKVVMSHYSLRLCLGISELFKVMVCVSAVLLLYQFRSSII